MLKIRPVDDRLLVRRKEAAAQTAGGLYVPSAAQQLSQKAEVLATGPGVSGVYEGDEIYIGKYSGTSIEVDGEELVLIRLEEVLAIYDK